MSPFRDGGGGLIHIIQLFDEDPLTTISTYETLILSVINERSRLDNRLNDNFNQQFYILHLKHIITHVKFIFLLFEACVRV